MTLPQAYAVIGGWDYEGEDFDSLRLFDYHSAAMAYAKELTEEQGYDYSKCQVRHVEQIPALAEIQAKAREAERATLLNTAAGITTPW
jgi:hypothetical protein